MYSLATKSRLLARLGARRNPIDYKAPGFSLNAMRGRSVRTHYGAGVVHKIRRDLGGKPAVLVEYPNGRRHWHWLDQIDDLGYRPGVNPVPPSRVKQAQALGLAFSGHKPELRETLDASRALRLPLKPGAKIPLFAFGELMGVKYRTVRDGREEFYEHTFRKQSRPLLAARHDGSRIYIVGGRYRFTDRGIVDQ